MQQDSKYDLFHIHDFFNTHIDVYCYSTIDLNYIFFDICFVNAFDSFIPVIILNMLRFKSSVLFGIHTSLDKSLTVLQLPTDLSNLSANG